MVNFTPTDFRTSIIVPTTASAERRDSLLRAIHSIENQIHENVLPIVVVNGDRYDRGLRKYLSDLPNIDYHYLPEGNLAKAILYGRRQVRTEFFGFLDDDDYLLRYAVATRLAAIEGKAHHDVAVFPGYRDDGESLRASEVDIELCQTDKLLALAGGNWLTSCGALYRSESIDLSFFENLQDFAEWTDVAFRLCEACSVTFGFERDHVVTLSEQSLSQQPQFYYAPVELLKKHVRRDMEYHVLKAFRDKYTAALHLASEHSLNKKDYVAAWVYHMRALVSRNGYKYLPYTRWLLMAFPAALCSQIPWSARQAPTDYVSVQR